MKRILLATVAAVSAWTGVAWQHPTRWLDELDFGHVVMIEPAEAAVQSQIVATNPTLVCADLTNAGTLCNTASIGSWDAFLTSGSVVVPAWVTATTWGSLECVGGGGGGGGANATTNWGIPGGAAGDVMQVSQGLFTAGATLTPTIGNAGTAGAAGAAGGAGGDTSIILSGTTYVAKGGSGGAGNQSASGIANGGTASGGTTNLTGQSGFAASAGATHVGGSGRWGAGAMAIPTAPVAGSPAPSGFGGGGTGARTTGGTAEVGGAGSAGMCRFTANGQ